MAFLGVVPEETLAASGGWATLTFKDAFGPLAAIASILGLTWLAVLLYADAIVSPGDTGLIYTAITSRLGYAMARNGNVPKPVAKLTRTGVPWVATVVAFVVGLVIFLPFPSWQQLVGLVTGATMLSFGSGPLVFAALRRELADQPRAFRLPGGDLIPFLAFFSSNMIVFWAGWGTNWKLFLGVLFGPVLLAVFRLTGSVRWRSPCASPRARTRDHLHDAARRGAVTRASASAPDPGRTGRGRHVLRPSNNGSVT